jgi:hypothetical protein
MNVSRNTAGAHETAPSISSLKMRLSGSCSILSFLNIKMMMMIPGISARKRRLTSIFYSPCSDDLYVLYISSAYGGSIFTLILPMQPEPHVRVCFAIQIPLCHISQVEILDLPEYEAIDKN